MNKERLTDLYNKYLANQCTPEELRELVDALGATGTVFREEEIFALFDNTWDEVKSSPGKYPLPAPPSIHRTPVRRLWPMAAAAAILVLLAAGTYFLLQQSKTSHIVIVQPQDIAPGGNKAVLTLANGQTIVLDNAQNGALTQQGNTQVSKQDSSLAYNTTGDRPENVSYNTLTTPKGGFFKLTLPDGTTVWLNAASSLRFPTAFVGNKREVQLSGEAYFDVTKNAAMPFKVMVNNMEVQVLGTEFNINAYADEKIVRTTLLKGAVNVQQGDVHTTLQPGDQAAMPANGVLFSMSRPDTEQVVAWKNGMFSFNGANLEQVMRQLSRWYDVEIKYTGPVKERLFVGSISRTYNLSEVLSILNASDVQFRLNGKQIIVTQ